jgi:hypothetical protein
MANLAIFEVFLIMLLAQAIHVLMKLSDRKKAFRLAQEKTPLRAQFKVKEYFTDNWMPLLINFLLILFFGYAYIRAGIDQRLAETAAGNEWWLPLMKYFVFFTTGFAVQSFFFWMLKKVFKITDIQPVAEDNPDANLIT